MIEKTNTNKLLKGIAFVSLGFALIVSIMVVINYLQLSKADPVNTELINLLVDRLNENPGDEALKQQIRELDLLARKAYFTNTWQIRTGGYLILLALAIFIIVFQFLELNTKKQVAHDGDEEFNLLNINKNTRWGIAILGGLFILIAVFLSFFQPGNLNDRLKNGNQNKQDTVLLDSQNNPDIVRNDFAESEESLNNEGEVKLPAESDSIPEEKQTESLTIPEIKGDQVLAESDQEVEVEQKAFPSNQEIMQNAASFRGYNGNGVVYQANIPLSWNAQTGKNILWKSKIPVKSYNSPIVWEDKIFLTGANDQVRQIYCFDKGSGSLLWTHDALNIPGSPAVPPKTTADTGLGAPTLTTDGRRVYAVFGTGDLVAVDMDGKRIWAKNLGVPQNHYGHSSSLIMHRDKLIVQYDQKNASKLMALSAESGALIWSTPRNVKISWASPVIVHYEGKSQIILAADPSVKSYNPYSGKELWSVDCIFGEVGPSVCSSDDIVFSVNDYAQIAAISLKDPSKTLWVNDEILSDIPSPVASKGLLIMPTSYGLLGCYDGKTGELLWEHEFDENTYSSPIIVGNRVYLLDISGTMHVFKLSRDGYQEVASCPLGEETVTTPAFADGRIYIRSDQHLFCIGSK